MSRTSRQAPLRKTNPRSTAEVEADAYHKQSDEVDLEGEALELQRCEELGLRTVHVFTPALLAYDRRDNRLSTARIDAGELFHAIWNPTSLLGKLRGQRLEHGETILARIEELGQWLARYHASSSHPGRGDEAFAWLRDSLRSKCEGIRRGRLLPARLIARLERRLLEELDRLGRIDHSADPRMRLCRIHGDFVVYNILMDRRHDLYVLDFGDTRIAYGLDDVARFYSNLRAIAQTNRERRQWLGAAADRFIAAYGLDREVVEAPYFRLHCAYNYLIHVYGHYCMKQQLSLISNLELHQISRSGVAWLKRNFG